MAVENLFEQERYFEHGAIFQARGCVPKTVVLIRSKQSVYGGSDVAEIRQDKPDALLEDPIRVITLLGQCPGISFYDYGEAHGYGFAKAPRAWFADEVIGELHISGDLSRKPF